MSSRARGATARPVRGQALRASPSPPSSRLAETGPVGSPGEGVSVPGSESTPQSNASAGPAKSKAIMA